MFDDVNQAVDDYLAKWQQFVAARKNKEFFERLKPTAIGWKVADLAEYDRLRSQWRTAADHMVEVWLNDRWIAKIHLKDTTLSGGVEIIKILQRRPGSTDATGLDHLDFLDMEETNTKAILAEETDIKWNEEQNGVADWTSIWFDGGEAKLRLNTVVDVCIAELQVISNHIRGAKFAVPIADNAPHVSEVE